VKPPFPKQDDAGIGRTTHCKSSPCGTTVPAEAAAAQVAACDIAAVKRRAKAGLVTICVAVVVAV
jgi:hypothetical protein